MDNQTDVPVFVNVAVQESLEARFFGKGVISRFLQCLAVFRVEQVVEMLLSDNFFGAESQYFLNDRTYVCVQAVHIYFPNPFSGVFDNLAEALLGHPEGLLGTFVLW